MGRPTDALWGRCPPEPQPGVLFPNDDHPPLRPQHQVCAVRGPGRADGPLVGQRAVGDVLPGAPVQADIDHARLLPPMEVPEPVAGRVPPHDRQDPPGALEPWRFHQRPPVPPFGITDAEDLRCWPVFDPRQPVAPRGPGCPRCRGQPVETRRGLARQRHAPQLRAAPDQQHRRVPPDALDAQVLPPGNLDAARLPALDRDRHHAVPGRVVDVDPVRLEAGGLDAHEHARRRDARLAGAEPARSRPPRARAPTPTRRSRSRAEPARGGPLACRRCRMSRGCRWRRPSPSPRRAARGRRAAPSPSGAAAAGPCPSPSGSPARAPARLAGSAPAATASPRSGSSPRAAARSPPRTADAPSPSRRAPPPPRTRPSARPPPSPAAARATCTAGCRGRRPQRFASPCPSSIRARARPPAAGPARSPAP